MLSATLSDFTEGGKIQEGFEQLPDVLHPPILTLVLPGKLLILHLERKDDTVKQVLQTVYRVASVDLKIQSLIVTIKNHKL